MKFQLGQTLVELLLAMGIAAIIIPALYAGVATARAGRPQQEQRMQAMSVLYETQEAVRNVREKGWVAFAVNGTYHPQISGSTWSLGSGEETLASGFNRKVDISDVYRDSSGAITTSGGTLDPSTKKILTTISWTQPYNSSITATEYLTRYLDNLSWVQTLASDFNAGTKLNTSVASVNGGEVILGAGGGGGDWCQPNRITPEIDLPKSGVANAITAIEGRVFAGTGANASGESFVDVVFSTNQDPPTYSTPIKTFSSSNKTNGVFGETNYAYITTDTNSKEVIILDLNQFTDGPADTKYKEVGSIDTSGNADGKKIYVKNNKAYIVTADSKLYIYDITNKNKNYTSGEALNGSGFTLSGEGKEIIIGPGGQYAYIMTGASTNQFQIVNISNASSPTLVSQKTIGSSQAGVDLDISPTESIAYAVVSYSAGKNNVYKLDITTPANPSIGSGYSTNGMSPKAVALVTGNRLIVVGTGGTYQYQVINTNTMGMCTATSGLTYSSGINDVAAVLQSNGYAYSYILTADNNAELKVILGGAGGQYSAAGTFVSSPFDVTTFGLNQTAFNRYDATFVKPAQTTIGFQVAAAAAVNNSCTHNNYTFIGPAHTSDPTDLYTAATSGIPLITTGSYYTNPGRCFKYKVYFTSSDPTQTPELYDFTVNYSP